MRKIARLVTVPVAMLALACAGGDATSDEALNAELQRDLELASSVGLELASAQNAGRQVVSAIETSGGTSIRRTPGQRRTPKAPPTPVVEPTAGVEATSEPVTSVAEANAAMVDAMPAPAPVETPEPGPVIAARPTPVQVSFPASGGGYGDGSGGGGTIGGGVIGVVIRGGGTGIDHCERHPRGGRPPMSVNDRFPRAPIPMSGTTFPRH